MNPEQQKNILAMWAPDILRREVGGQWSFFDGIAWWNCKGNEPLADLNAAHALEKARIFPKGLGMVYGRNLHAVCKDDWSFSATAAQRYEAMMKTVGFWEG